MFDEMLIWKRRCFAESVALVIRLEGGYVLSAVGAFRAWTRRTWAVISRDRKERKNREIHWSGQVYGNQIISIIVQGLC